MVRTRMPERIERLNRRPFWRPFARRHEIHTVEAFALGVCVACFVLLLVGR